MQTDTPARVYERHRRELVNYATRLVVRESVAEELAQEAALRLLQDTRLPNDEGQMRAWLFRVVSNLAIDYLRRHSTWIQQARRTMSERYAHTCALVTKQGVCHQCVELDGFFNGQSRDPLEGTERNLEARLAILRDTREAALGPWHRRMLRLVDDVLEGGGS